MKPTRYFSKIQENKVANELGGKRTPNSGATPYRKGDVTLGQATDNGSWLLECKTCTKYKKSFSIREEWLTTTKAESIQQGKLGYAVVFNFGPNEPNYYIIDEKTFKSFLEVENENNN